MKICGENMPAGVNVNCLSALAQVKNAFILKSGTTFDSLGDFLNLVVWKIKVQEDLSIFAVAGLFDYEITTKEPMRRLQDWEQNL